MKNTNPAAPTTFYKIDNPEEFTRNMLRLFEEGGRAISGMLARSDAKISPYSGASEVSEAAKTVSDIFLRMWMTDPTMLAVAQGRLARSYMRNTTSLIVTSKQPRTASRSPWPTAR